MLPATARRQGSRSRQDSGWRDLDAPRPLQCCFRQGAEVQAAMKKIFGGVEVADVQNFTQARPIVIALLVSLQSFRRGRATAVGPRV